MWFPYLASDRVLRTRLGASWLSGERHRPALVFSHRDNNSQRVAAFCEKGARLGLQRGLGLADMRAMHPDVEVLEVDTAADHRLLVALADWCDRYTPLVALDGADGLFLDITGCAHLFGGEQAMLDDMLDRFHAQGFHASAGLASTPGMAWAAAHFLKALPVPPGGEAVALAPLPLDALRLEQAQRTGLESVGLRTVGAIMDAPRAPLARRFGKGLLLRLDQALGVVEEAVSPRLAVASLSVERQLAEPIVTDEEIERLVLLLAATLKEDLERRGEGARLLQLALFRVDGIVKRITIGASRPLREPAMIKRLFHERMTAIGNLDADCGFELVRLSVIEAAPFAQEQGDLSGRSDDGEADLALFADRVRARLGEEALMTSRLVESHVPERAVDWSPFCANPGSKVAEAMESERPVRLLARPEPVEVAMAEVPEGPPYHFRWRRVFYRVARAEGPERIAPEWWLEGEQEGPTRDYFRVEDEEGRRYWLFRQGLYGTATEMPRWFLHGIFA
ncbi:DNA polymerase Y family protein [Mesorhizobium sp. CAU 1741]|uniref:Y-family DNA polymerase n=1 Tax=Mesorhizobium sp. CAU 1741 TaxID=3140366 RepID=UPI00325BCFD9